jgi:hypothetical protein
MESREGSKRNVFSRSSSSRRDLTAAAAADPRDFVSKGMDSVSSLDFFEVEEKMDQIGRSEISSSF